MRIGLENGDYTIHITETQIVELMCRGSRLVDTLLEQEFILERSENIRSLEGVDLNYNGSNFGNAIKIEIRFSLAVLDKVRRGELVDTKYDERNSIFICKDYS